MGRSNDMKKMVKAIALAVMAAALFAGCGSKNPVAGKRMALEAMGTNFVYVFEDEQFYMEGFEGMKMKYRYDKESDSIVYTELDGSERVIKMSELKRVK